MYLKVKEKKKSVNLLFQFCFSILSVFVIYYGDSLYS